MPDSIYPDLKCLPIAELRERRGDLGLYSSITPEGELGKRCLISVVLFDLPLGVLLCTSDTFSSI
jgi:hypothetical protein